MVKEVAQEVRPAGTGMPAGRFPALACRHAIVTGASRGIGRAIAARLAAAGTDLTLVARDAARLAEAAAALQDAHGVRVAVLALDLTDSAAIAPALERLAGRGSPVDALVNNAGAGRSMPFAKMTDTHWHEMLALNLTSAFALTRAVVPQFLAGGGGRIVNVASTAGLTGYAYVAAYCAAKHGLVGLTRALAVELAGRGITVNAVCPGYTATDMLDQTLDNIVARTGRSREEALQSLVAANPQRRPVQPDEVAEAVAYLLSPGAAAVNGACLPVDGGEVLK